jgi:hypothetical protein
MPGLRGFALVELASVLQVVGRTDEARSAMAEALATYERKGDVVSAARTKRLIAMMERQGS